MDCRHCKKKLEKIFINLGNSPPSNNYISLDKIFLKEKSYPLNILICENCLLVQTEDFTDAVDLFTDDYAYFSSFSSSWLQHAKKYVNMIVEKKKLNSNSHVVEIASNDGYLLQFIKEKNIPCTGIEPTLNTAIASRKKNINTINEFFGKKLAKKLHLENCNADLMIGNNVLAHVPDINDFLSGFEILLKPDGILTFEFPHLDKLVQYCQFDTIYHEHFSYISLTALKNIFKTNGLQIYDVEEIPTHGGSLRVYGQKKSTGKNKITSNVDRLIKSEEISGIKLSSYYEGFEKNCLKIKTDFVTFLNEAKKNKKKISGYGAAAKGNTLLNYSNVDSKLIPYVVDLNPAKQGKFLPGSKIKIVDEDYLKIDKPDFIVIFPWNIKNEIINQLEYTKEWNVKFVIAIPHLEII